MNKFKSLALKIFTVPLWLLVILCVISGISLVCIFLNGLDTQFYAYIAYFISASNMIKLSDALISMLLLETSMLAQFGQDNTIEFKRLMISFTGGGIAIIITFMSVYLFVQSNRQLKQIKK